MATFRLHGTRVLAVELSGDAVKAKNGAMVAYDGEMTVKKMAGGGEGLRGLVTRRITGEAIRNARTALDAEQLPTRLQLIVGRRARPRRTEI